MGTSYCSKNESPLWRLYNNILPTWKNLSRRVTSILPCCDICSKSKEDTLCTFFWCRMAAKTWLNSNFSHFVNLFLSPATYKAILEQMFSGSSQDSAQCTYFLWCIWSSRNNMPFRNITPNYWQIILQATCLWKEDLCVHSITADMIVTQSFFTGMPIDPSATTGNSRKGKEIP